MDKPKYQKVAAGWYKTLPSGKQIISITVNEDIAAGTRLNGWPNDRKEEGSKQPDWNFTLDTYKPTPRPKPDADGGGAEDKDVPF